MLPISCLDQGCAAYSLATTHGVYSDAIQSVIRMTEIQLARRLDTLNRTNPGMLGNYAISELSLTMCLTVEIY